MTSLWRHNVSAPTKIRIARSLRLFYQKRKIARIARSHKFLYSDLCTLSHSWVLLSAFITIFSYSPKAHFRTHWCSFASNVIFNPKRAGLFGPISQPGGHPPPLRSCNPIDETSSVWYLWIAITLPSPSVPKKVQTNLVWRHSDVMSKTWKSPKIAKIMVFSLFFQAKVAFFDNDVCQSMLTHVLTPNK